MNARELRKLVADLDDETVVWIDLGDGTMSPAIAANLHPATDERFPCLVLGVDRARFAEAGSPPP